MPEIFRKIKSSVAELGKLAPMALVTTFLPILGSSVLIFFASPIAAWLRENWTIGMPLYAIGVAVFCGLALLPTNVIGVIGGWAFGFYFGIIALMAGIVCAAFGSFLIHRRVVQDTLPEIVAKNKKADAIYKALVGQSFWRTTLIITLVRFSIIMPFAFTNFLFASAKVSKKSYLIGTTIGMLPRSSAVVFAGASIAELSLDRPTDTVILVLGVGATVLFLIVISILSRRALENLAETEVEKSGI